MALYHFWQTIITLIFGSAAWIFLNYLVGIVHNMYVTKFPQWSGMPQIDFAMNLMAFGLWILVMVPTAFYLWANTQRPEESM